MKKAAPAKESGLEVMQAQFSRKARSTARVDLVPTRSRMYRLPVVTLLATGFSSSNNKLAQQRPKSIARRFFTSATLYGGRAWETERSAGCQLARSANPRTAATNHRLAAVGGSSKTQVGAPLMHHTPARSPSALQDRAAAHRAMALAALRADSSLSVRLKRYNHHMTVARTLEAEQQHTTPTRDPRAALAWLQSGRPVRIDSLNLHDHLRHVRALAALEAKGGAQ